MSRRNAGGFTIIELLLTVTVLAVIVALSVPSFANFVRNSRATSELNDWVSFIHTARSQAATLGRDVTVCPSPDGASCDATAKWTDGAIITTTGGDATVLRVLSPMHDNSSFVGNYTSFGFEARGRLDVPSLDPMVTFWVRCDDRGLDAARLVEMRKSGQVNVYSQNHPMTEALRTTHKLPNDDAASCS